MLEETYFKIREAKFFLGHLTKEGRKAVNQNHEFWLFYFSAFLSASRSITLILQKESNGKYKGNDPKKDLFNQWMDMHCSEEERRLLGNFKDLRNETLKEGSPEVDTGTKWMPPHLLPSPTGDPRYYGVTIAVGVHTRYLPNENGEEKIEVDKACSQYIELIEKFVAWYRDNYES